MCKTDYLRRIAAHFPDVSWTVSRLIRNGFDHDVVILDDALVFRFPKTDDALARFRRETRLLTAVAGRLPLAVPRYDYLADDGLFGGYRIISGQPFWRSLAGRWTRRECESAAGDLGRFLGAFHSVPLAEARRLGMAEEAERWGGRAHMEARFAGLREIVFPRLDKDMVAWLTRSIEVYLQLDLEVELRPCHLDIYESHLMVDPVQRRLSGIIDFADAEIIDPAFDFSVLWIYGQAFVEAALARYGSLMDPQFLARSRLPYRFAPATFMLWDLTENAGPTRLYHKMHRITRRNMVAMGGV